MMEKFSSEFFTVSGIAIAGLFIAGASVFAAINVDKAKLLQYPIGELGGCKNFEECRVYCNKDENIPTCNRFAIKNGLLTDAEAKDAQQLLSLMDASGLPGKCQGAIECFSYCESVAHVNECWDYATRHGLNRGADLATVQRLADFARGGGTFPGNCQGQAECEAYCTKSSHIDECLAFADRVGGILSPQELADAHKVAPFLKTGQTPGGCSSKATCEAYCAVDSHINECVDFWVKAGFVKPEEADIIKKAGGKGPGDCRSKDACEAYCKDEVHIDECVNFAVKAGFITPEEADQARKYKITSGPGGCQSKADCESFCAIPGNGDTCFNWAKDHGIISKEDAQQIEESRRQAVENISKANPIWLACMEQKMGSDSFQRFKEGKLDRSEFQKQDEAQKACANLPHPEMLQKFTGAPPEWLACMEKNLGPDLFDRFKTGNLRGADFQVLEDTQKTCKSALGEDIRPLIKECIAKPNCSEFMTCLNKLPKGSRQQPSGQEQQDTSGLSDRLKACREELTNNSINNCLSKSCSEFEACINALQQGSKEQGGQQQQQSMENPKIRVKAEACAQEKINACLDKPCSEFQACLNAAGSGGQGPSKGGPPNNPAIEAKFKSCTPQKGGEQQPPSQQQPPNGPQQPQQSPRVDCSSFASTPSCSYVGSPDSQSYQLCKQCFPNK